jgi:DNA/RNA endonuclease G (NUC1)
MRSDLSRVAISALIGLGLLNCTEAPTEPTSEAPTARPSTAAPVSGTQVLISQLYGGGGNSGATLKNDFIELLNASADTVNVAGWSVQYASAAGTSWQVTALSGKIPPGGYYLVQEALGAGGSTNLPAPDASGTIAMSATAGKVALVGSITALSGTCPAPGAAVDEVSFGTTATNCGAGTTATLANATAAVRADSGCRSTGNLSTDFAVTAPSPRNSATARHSCQVVPAGPLDHVVLAGPATLTVGTTAQFTATPKDAANITVTDASVTWRSSDSSIASVDASGKVTGLVASVALVTITATAVEGAITRSAEQAVQVVNPAINWVDISSSSTSLPPGFQTQMFATARVSSGGTIIPATFTFEAVDSEIATVQTVANTALVTGVAAPADGTTRPGFRVTATPIGGGAVYSFITHTILIETPHPASPSIYAVNDEFGDPTPASPSDSNDLLIVRPQYTLSYNESRGTPNWVSYELDARQITPGQDRCNCFTADPNLPAAKQIFTSDYTNGGFDRGHMTRSFDRTAGNTDNAATFYLTNIVPQMADLNQGVWAQFENALGDSATLGGRAVYIVTGPLYSRSHGLTTLKGEGKVAIPDSTWKVALIGPRTGGIPFTHGSITDWSDLPGFTVLAVNMPNVAGVRNDPWSKYLTTVDKIEAATGLDLFSLLPTMFQDAVEAGDHAPTGRFSFGGTLLEGSPVSFDGATSTDPDIGGVDLGRPEALGYAWDFAGATGAGVSASHTFGRPGAYPVTLTVTDAFGWPSVVTHNVTIANVAPVVGSFAGADLIATETYQATGSFADPGEEGWSATVDYGDGSGPQALVLTGKSFALSHTYADSGTYTVTVQVTDEFGGPGSATATVRVESSATALQQLTQAIGDLQGQGDISRGEATAFRASLDAAARQMARGDAAAARGELGAFINKVNAAVQAGRLTAAEGAALIASAQRIVAALGQP